MKNAVSTSCCNPFAFKLMVTRDYLLTNWYFCLLGVVCCALCTV